MFSVKILMFSLHYLLFHLVLWFWVRCKNFDEIKLDENFMSLIESSSLILIYSFRISMISIIQAIVE